MARNWTIKRLASKIGGCNENALLKSYDMSPHYMCHWIRLATEGTFGGLYEAPDELIFVDTSDLTCIFLTPQAWSFERCDAQVF